MATEKDLELLDQYLSNKMDEASRIEFEQRINSDSGLKNEFEFQKQLVEGIRKARVNELKTLLNNTVIPPAQTGPTLIKIATWVVIAGMVGSGIYYWINKNSEPEAVSTEVVETDSILEEPAIAETIKPEATAAVEEQADAVTEKSPAPEVSSPKKTTKTSPVKQPELKPYDPTQETDSNATHQPAIALDDISEQPVSTSSVQVETDNTIKKFNFHYEFKDNKLLLYGSFEKDLYTILEFFNNNKRTVFLYYNSNYYLLDESVENPTPLKSLNDPVLIQKLREYKGN